MDDRSELLMAFGVVGACADCRDDRLFVPVDDDVSSPGEFCCTSCGAAIVIDPLLIAVESALPGTSLVG